MLVNHLPIDCPHCECRDVHHAYSQSGRDYFVCASCHGMYFTRLGRDDSGHCIEKHSIDHYCNGYFGLPEGYKPQYKK